MALNTPVVIDRQRIRELIERESRQLDERTQGSAAMYRRARQSLSGGVASHYQARDPWPIYLTTGEGPVVYDVDGNRMWDFHNGFGSMVQGHAHPGDRQGRPRARRRGHALRRDDRGRRASSPRSSSAAGASIAGAS